ncbi:DUF4331 domain-containing protein [Leptolyngbya sp. FACHB-321]|uniref:DUF4331 domain-containing protein n=1 Tax=Leptolyngbya sp. FACHB-321 TaxID=2692807 RepID=UPI001688EEA6|nr:DUF4331 domain-containing protein [Leptolyngbya sp. FACHB-321]MBD2036903.1 DUF4331 domain-containing protein [Leptolyngbya sp. FACHB-321]
MQSSHEESFVQLNSYSAPVSNASTSKVEVLLPLPQKVGKLHWLRATGLCLAALLLVFCQIAPPALASDHQDTTFLATKLTAADLTDLYVFESATDPANVVLSMNFDPLITAGEVRPFDPAVLYQFKIDNTGDGVEDLVLQFQSRRRGRGQSVVVRGPGKPKKVGTESRFLGESSVVGPLDQAFTAGKMKVFVGTRKDPFFFDLEQFFKIIPDRNYLMQPNPAPPLKVVSFRPPGQAVDTLEPFNVHSIVVELPRKLLGTGKIGVWMTTSVKTPRLKNGNYAQIERLAVPALNELFMDFQAHNESNLQTPTGDAANQSQFIRSFVQTIGRPAGIADAVISVAIPDVIQADLSKQNGTYFGTQLAGNFGGRRPKDDVIDVTASVVFGSAVTGITQGAIPALTSDNVGPKEANFLPTFPYLGNPR